MNNRIKNILLIIIAIQDSVYCSDIYSLLDIYKMRSDKSKKNRIYYGKKILMKHLNYKPLFLINNITDMSVRTVCSKNMQRAVKKEKKGNAKRYDLILSTCEVKSRL